MRSGFCGRVGGRFPLAYADAVLADSPIAYWRHNGLSSSTVGIDSSGNGRTGTYSHTGMQGAGALFSGSGGAATYSGSSQYMTVPHNSALKPTAAITLESWFVLDDLSQWRGIISTTQSGGWVLDYTGAGSGSALRCNMRRNGAYGTAQLASVIEVGKVYHAVATYDGRYTRLYLGSLTEDTVEVAVNDAGANYPIQYATNNALCIGCEASAGSTPEGQYWDGVLGETAIYSTALSPSRILAHNQAARGLAA